MIKSGKEDPVVIPDVIIPAVGQDKISPNYQEPKLYPGGLNQNKDAKLTDILTQAPQKI